MSIKLKLAIMFLGVAIIPTLFVSILTFNNYQHSLEATHLEQMWNISVFKTNDIETHFNRLKIELGIMQGSYVIRKGLPGLGKFVDEPSSTEFSDSIKMLDEQLPKANSLLGLVDIMLVCPDGRIVYSSNLRHRPEEIGKRLPELKMKAFEDNKNGPSVSEIFPSKLESNRPGMLITTPVYEPENVLAGVLVFETDIESTCKMIGDMAEVGQTGEILLGRKEGDKVIFLSSLKYDHGTASTRAIRIGDRIGVPIQLAVQGRNGAGQSIDYRGEDVLAAWRYIPSLDLGVVAKIDTREAFADAVNLRNLAMTILVLVSLLAGIIAFSVAKSISGPISALKKGVEIIGHGNLDYKVATDSKDEIGQLSREFETMTGNLKKVTDSRDFERRRLHQVLDSLPAYVVLLTPDYHVAFANRFFEDRFGKAGGRRCYEYLYQRDIPCESCETLKALKTNAPHRWNWIGPDGRSYEVSDFPFSDTDGSPLVLEMGIDVTERKRAEVELLKYRNNLETLVSERTSQLKIVNDNLQVEIEERRRAEKKILIEIEERKRAEKEAQEHVQELSRFNKTMVDRELRMMELKKQINEFCIKTGEPERYGLDEIKQVNDGNAQ